MKYAYEYSSKEVELIKALEMEDLLHSPSMVPHLVYRELAIACFRDPEIPVEIVQSVRRCFQALEKGQFRLTPEFDALIQLEE